MPVPAIALHGSGPRGKIARLIDATFEGWKLYDRVVTLEFDWDRVVPPPKHNGVRNLFRFLERNAANISAAARVGMEFSAHSVDELLAVVQTRLYRLLQWLVPAFVAFLLAIPVAKVFVVAPAEWYGLPTSTFTPIDWMATGAGWLKMAIVGGITLLITLSGLRLVLTVSPRPALITFRSVAFLFLQPILVALIAVFAADWWVFCTVFGVIGMFSLFASGIGSLVLCLAVFAALAALRLRWTRKSLRGPIKVMLDAFRYLGEPGYRPKIQKALEQAVYQARDRTLNNEDFVLIAQGLGTVMALDSIVHSRAFGKKDRLLLVTMGSPLRRYWLTLYPRTLFPEWLGILVDLVAGRLREFRWLNIHRPMDYVGGSLGLTAFNGRDVCTEHKSRVPNHTDYWLDAEVRRAFRRGLHGLTTVQALSVPMKEAAHRMPHPTRSDFDFHVPARVRMALGTTFSVATFAGMLWWVSVGTGVLTPRIDATPDMLDRGVVVDAKATHRREAVERDGGVTYVHHWEFEFADASGAARTLRVQRDASDAFLDVPHRFDDRALTRYIRAGCAGTALPLWWSAGNLEEPCTVAGIRLRYYPGEITIFDLPDFPRRRFGTDPVRGWTEAGVVSGVLSILIVIPLVFGAKLYLVFVGVPLVRRRTAPTRPAAPTPPAPPRVSKGNVSQRAPNRVGHPPPAARPPRPAGQRP